jgi:hypothetical protein
MGEDHRFAAAMRQAGRGVLKGHRSRQPEGLLVADIGRHTHATIAGLQATLSIAKIALSPTAAR